MVNARFAFRVVLGAAAVVALAFVAAQVREKRTLAVATVDDIEAQLAGLDPVTRTAVVARLSADAAQDVHDKLGKA